MLKIAFSLLILSSSASSQKAKSEPVWKPEVTLLIDNVGANKSADIRSLLDAVSAKKGRDFYFGVAYDAGNATLDAVASERFKDTFNLGVAENNCKWEVTERVRGTTDITACKRSKSFFTKHGAAFRLHNYFWHIQRPKWLTKNDAITPEDLVDDIIPNHIEAMSRAMGHYTSVDVLNEIVGDTPPTSMTPFACVASKHTWPTLREWDDPRPFLTSTAFIDAAFRAAALHNEHNATLFMNDYNTGGRNVKTECYHTIATDLLKRGVPIGGVGFQSHVGAKWGQFDDKQDVRATYARFERLGLDVAVTEFDVWVQDSSYESARWQAAVYGDYVDACLYADNCREFVVWGLYDAVSWRAESMPLLFDAKGNRKTSYYEVMARMERYVAGKPAVCGSAAGADKCNLSKL